MGGSRAKPIIIMISIIIICSIHYFEIHYSLKKTVTVEFPWFLISGKPATATSDAEHW